MGTGEEKRGRGSRARRRQSAFFVELVLLGGLLAGCESPSPVDFSTMNDAMAPCDFGTPAFADLPDLGWAALHDLGSRSAALSFVVDDGDTGQPTPSRVIFRPPPSPGFAGPGNGGATGAVVSPGVLGTPEGVLLAYGVGAVLVPAGTYDLFITRGPEYEAEQLQVTVADGETRDVHVTLDRTVDTCGWLAADLHVHTSRSFDSKLIPERRLISMATNGVEVVVSTDHNVATDLAPVAKALGYGPDLMGTVIGDEFNFREGHGGAYPVPYDAMLPGGGVPPYQNLVNGACADPIVGINCLTAADAFPIMSGQIAGTTVVTVNHPWWDNGDLGYFTNIQWGAGTKNALPAPLHTATLFDAMELINGYQAYGVPENNLLADWFFLLGQGHRITALGNSDTHGMNMVRSGWPRTWLRLPNSQPGEITGDLLADALKHNRAIASTGPFITMTVDGANIGDQVQPQLIGEVSVQVFADAPGWISVDQVRVYVNGEVRATVAVPPGRRPAFSGTFVIPMKRDGWIVAQATGSQVMPGDVVGEAGLMSGHPMQPWAVTNPIYVDADSNGIWSPPHNMPHLVDKLIDAPAEPPHDGCGVGEEPPLDTPQHVLMPLLY